MAGFSNSRRHRPFAASIADTLMRATQEWVGKSDDQRIPPKVRLRLWHDAKGCCQGCGRKIAVGDRWDIDHTVALCNGGQHRESNLRILGIACGCHPDKSAADREQYNYVKRVQRRYAGIQKPRTITTWRKFDGTPVKAGRER
jgi:5-methylcytosine-specific restriction enzyme A